VRTLFSVQGGLAMTAIYRFGSDEQRNHYLPKMRTGEILGAFALTEPESGSDPGSMTTIARRDGSDWVLNGYKRWNTNCLIADIAITWAMTDEGIRGFIVPTDAKGLERRAVTGKYSLRAAAATEFEMHDVRLPADAVLPNVVGLKGPLACLSEARYGIIWGMLGVMRSCLETALTHSTGRVQFGKPIGAYQLTQAKLSDMLLKYSQAQLLAHQIGRLKQRGELTTEQISMGKLNNVNAAIEVARTARSILGGNGITSMYPVMRHMANLESILTYEGTAEVHTLIIGQGLTGLSAFR
jgi:glutaryl-CoA dehydrogenase